MITTKKVLYSRANKEGKYPLAIRITKDRKYSLVFIGQAIDKNQWNSKERKVKKNHPNAARLNALLEKKISEINKAHLTSALEDQDASAGEIHKRMVSKNPSGSFAIEAQKYLDNLKGEGKYKQYTADLTRVNRFIEFVDGKDITFEKITVSLLKQFRAYLKGKYNVGERTVINTLIIIRTIYNQAIKSGLVEKKHYPFGKDKIPIRFPDSVKLGLSMEEIEQLIAVDLTDYPKIHHARNVWLVSFYFAGMRVGDVLLLRWSDIQNGRLHYQMSKNTKADSIKVPEQALEILDEYRPEQSASNDLIFPELKIVDDFTDRWLVERKTSYATKTLNKYLKRLEQMAGLTKKLRMHIARHSFGNISGDRIPIQMLQKLYRHSNITTTINYQKTFIYKDADDALDAVLNTKRIESKSQE